MILTADQVRQMNDACNAFVLSLFPLATRMELYGAQIHLDADTMQPIAATCGGVTKEIE